MYGGNAEDRTQTRSATNCCTSHYTTHPICMATEWGVDPHPTHAGPIVFKTSLRAAAVTLPYFGQGGGIRTHSAKGNGFTARPDSPTSAPPDMYGIPSKIRTLTKRVGAAYATVTPRVYMARGERFELSRRVSPPYRVSSATSSTSLSNPASLKYFRENNALNLIIDVDLRLTSTTIFTLILSTRR